MSDFVNITRNNNDIISTYTNNQMDEGGDEGIAGLAAQLDQKADLSNLFKITRTPWGTYDNATVVNNNNTGSQAMVMGFTDPSQIATYDTRDAVIEYNEFKTVNYTTYVPISFTATTVTLQKIDSRIKVGSVLDCYPIAGIPNYATYKPQRYSGIVTAINGNVIMVSGWFQYNNTSAGQVPPQSGYYVLCDEPTKVWVNNDNLILNTGGLARTGVIAEYGLMNYKYQSDNGARANGIDMVQFSGMSDFAFNVRRNPATNSISQPYNAGYQVSDSYIGFYAAGNNQNNFYGMSTDGVTNTFYVKPDGSGMYAGLLNLKGGIQSDNGNFYVDNTGKQKFRKVFSGSYNTTGTTLNFDGAQFFTLLGAGNNYIVPSPTNYANFIFKICALATGITLTIPNYSNGVSPITLTTGKSIELYSDGSNWYTIS